MSGGKVKINGLVKKSTDAGIVVEVHPVDNSGVIQTDTTYIRTLAKQGKFVLWDNEKEEWRAVTPADIVRGDEVFTY